MSNRQVFSAQLEKDDHTEGTGVRMPFDVREVFGSGRVPVRGTINGVPFRSTLAPYKGVVFLPVPKALRDAARSKAGDVVEIILERDLEERVITPPRDLQNALDANPDVKAAWDKLSYTHRKEHARALEEAKRPETRQRRLDSTIAMLKEKKR